MVHFHTMSTRSWITNLSPIFQTKNKIVNHQQARMHQLANRLTIEYVKISFNTFFLPYFHPCPLTVFIGGRFVVFSR